MRRRFVEEDDLEALDPTTGDALVDATPSPSLPVGDRASWTTYRRRLRRARIVLILLSFTSAGFAAYTGWSIATLRRIERTWRTAMAVDEVRAGVDERVFEELRRFDPDDDTTDSFLLAIGASASSELEKARLALTDLSLGDERTIDLRDAMVEALAFRQRQMSPQRRQLGDSPLVVTEQQLASELRRWRLEPSRVPVPRLAAAAQTVDRLGRFVDEPTSTVVVGVAASGYMLQTIDLDANTFESRAMPEQVDRLLAISPNVVVTVGATGVRAYDVARPTSQDPIWERPGATAFVASGDNSVWIHEGASARRLDRTGAAVGGPFPLPPGTVPVGATRSGLVLMSAPPTGNDEVTLWIPEQGEQKTLATGVRRFIGAGHGVVIVERRFAGQGPDGLRNQFLDSVDVVADTGRSIEIIDFNVPLVSAAQRPGGIEIAAAGGPLAGRRARVFRFTFPGSSATGGPSVAVDPAALAWSPSGDHLFWVTPGGDLAMYSPTRRRVELVRSRGIALLRSIVTFESQR